MRSIEETITHFNLVWHRNTLIYFLNICFGLQRASSVVFTSGDAMRFNYKSNSHGNKEKKVSDLCNQFGWIKLSKSTSIGKFSNAANYYTLTTAGRRVFEYFLAKIG